jgi:hypothetical protein
MPEYRYERPEHKLWLIWSNEHRAWWAPLSCGYVFDKAKAGRYGFEQAVEICKQANYDPQACVPNETMIPED